MIYRMEYMKQKRCKNCILFDPEHWWCNAGSDREPNTKACEWFVEIEPEHKSGEKKMIDKKKIIEELKMAYMYSNVDGDNTLVPQQLVLDIITLLKEQEARVMTLEEVKNAENAAEPFWCEFNDRDLCSYGSWRTGWHEKTFGMEPQHCIENYFERAIVGESEYGSEWRCWTSKPTDEQRKAVKWND